MRCTSVSRCAASASHRNVAKQLLCPYATLGIAPGASVDAIRKQYRVVVLAAHPDVAGGDAETFKRLTAAYHRCMADLQAVPCAGRSAATADDPEQHRAEAAADLYSSKSTYAQSSTAAHSAVNGASEEEGGWAREAAALAVLVVCLVMCVGDDLEMLKRRSQRARDDQEAQDVGKTAVESTLVPIRLKPIPSMPSRP